MEEELKLVAELKTDGTKELQGSDFNKRGCEALLFSLNSYYNGSKGSRLVECMSQLLITS